jgi:hypothetical protein
MAEITKMRDQIVANLEKTLENKVKPRIERNDKNIAKIEKDVSDMKLNHDFSATSKIVHKFKLYDFTLS